MDNLNNNTKVYDKVVSKISSKNNNIILERKESIKQLNDKLKGKMEYFEDENKQFYLKFDINYLKNI